jgi:arylsulfatase A-like enzyme
LTRFTRGHTQAGAVLSAALLATCLIAGCGESGPARPNIVVVVLDTVRRDVSELSSTGVSPTPNLDRLGSESTVFTNAWSTGPWTVPSHASMLTGLLPSSHGCTGYNSFLGSERRTVAEYLVGHGYETVAFFSNPWLTDRMTGMMRGFETRYEEVGHDTRVFNIVDQGGEATSRNIATWLGERKGDKPFLMFVNFLEPHLPYSPPEAYRLEHLPDLPARSIVTTEWAHEFNAGMYPAQDVDWKRVISLYLGDVATADSYLGELLGELERQGLYENTAVIVTSDHGENLGEHGYMDHQFGLFETLLAVPLVVRTPGQREPAVRTDPAMLTDIFPTALELAGVENAPDLLHARSLLGPPAPEDRPLIAEYSGAGVPLIEILQGINPELDVSQMVLASATVRVGQLRFTLSSDGEGNLQDFTRNPVDRADLARHGRTISSSMVRLLPAVVQPSGEMEMDEETRESLRSLGYLP